VRSATQSSKLARFVVSYGAANAGATIAFVPLLILILPLKAGQISPDSKLQLLSLALLCGAITASLANITAGWLSDRMFARHGSRIAQIALSLTAVLVALFAFSRASSPVSLIAAIAFFQLSLNFLFSPLGALLADKVPHHAKGRTSALLNLGMPIGTLMIAALTLPFFETENERLLALGSVILLFISPLIFIARTQPNLDHKQADTDQSILSATTSTKDLFWAWIARFSVQISGAVIFGYILFFLQDVISQTDGLAENSADQALGQMSLAATPVAIIVGLSVGYLSDRLRSRKAFLLIAALMIAISLSVMVMWPYWRPTFAAYVVFSAGLTAYLTIDAAIVTQLLARSAARAKTLGIMNLTNTLPAILAPGLALALNSSSLSQSELIPLMQFAAGLAFLGAFAASRIRSVS